MQEPLMQVGIVQLGGGKHPAAPRPARARSSCPCPGDRGIYSTPAATTRHPTQPRSSTLSATSEQYGTCTRSNMRWRPADHTVATRTSSGGQRGALHLAAAGSFLPLDSQFRVAPALPLEAVVGSLPRRPGRWHVSPARQALALEGYTYPYRPLSWPRPRPRRFEHGGLLCDASFIRGLHVPGWILRRHCAAAVHRRRPRRIRTGPCEGDGGSRCGRPAEGCSQQCAAGSAAATSLVA